MSADSNRPVFIIGGSRTGSTMLQTILAKSPELSITDELQFRTPRWLHRDLVADIRRHVGPLDAPGARDRLVDLFYSGKPVGWFWSASDRLLDRDLFLEELGERPLTLRSIFNAILRAHAQRRGKPRIGAKFPVHYSYTEQLLDWYPDCLLIHTTRNPKAVYASQAEKYVSSDQNFVLRLFMRFRQFVHINIQISWTAHLHQRFRNQPNYRLVRYEDMVTDAETEIRSLCQFLGIEFQPEMLRPKQFGSSYDGKPADHSGIASDSLDRWRSSISPLTAKIIDILHPFAFGILGYTKSSTLPVSDAVLSDAE